MAIQYLRLKSLQSCIENFAALFPFRSGNRDTICSSLGDVLDKKVEYEEFVTEEVFQGMRFLFLRQLLNPVLEFTFFLVFWFFKFRYPYLHCRRVRILLRTSSAC